MSAATERLYKEWVSNPDVVTFAQNKHGVYIDPRIRSKDNPYYTVEQDEAMQRLDRALPRGDLSYVLVVLGLFSATLTTLAVGFAIWHIVWWDEHSRRS